PAGGLGQADRRRAQRHRDPRPLPAPRRNYHHERPQLPPAKPDGRLLDNDRNTGGRTKTSHSACRLGTDFSGSRTPQKQTGDHRLNLRILEAQLANRSNRDEDKTPFTPAALISPPSGWF